MKNPTGTKKYMAFAALGFLIFLAGIALQVWGPEGTLASLAGILIGIGASGMISTAIAYKNPEAYKKRRIDQSDERNQTIHHKAKARVYDLLFFVQCALLIGASLFEVDVKVILVLVAVFAFYFAAEIYFVGKYNKEM
jgi:hypothetical protein